MRDLKITIRENSRQFVVIGRGDQRQLPEEICNLVLEQLKKMRDPNHTAQQLEIVDYEFLDQDSNEDLSDAYQIDVHHRTEEPYCRSNYGARV